MSEALNIVLAGAAGVLVALAAGVPLTRASSRWVPRRANHRGRAIPVVLGFGLGATLVVPPLMNVALGTEAVPASIWVSALVLLLAGAIDDRIGGGARGLVGHVRSLLRGRPTTGILKLGAGIGGAAWVALDRGGSVGRIVLALLVVALATNVWNALDVRPGRAVTWGLVALVALLPVTAGTPLGLLVAAILGGCVAVLPLDLRERAMLGDAGSNPLGFLIGAAAAWTLPIVPLAGVAVLLGALQLAAETVTISRIIEEVPPLRWFDRVGRPPA